MSTIKSASPRDPRLHVLFCGAPSVNDDYAILSQLSENGAADRWSCLKGVRAGDRVLFYTVHERRAFMASGWALADAKPTDDPDDEYRYRAEVGAIRLLRSPTTRAAIRLKFPKWKWARFTRNITSVPPEIADRLWIFAHKEGQILPALPPDAGQLGKPSGHSGKGAGYGNARTNALVEKAAVAKAKRHLKSQGFTVCSREREKIGYDLDAFRGTEELHVEVKGVSGTGDSFIITQNEVATAHVDPSFRLIVVSCARTKQASIAEYAGADFESLFSLSPISYFAAKK